MKKTVVGKATGGPQMVLSLRNRVMKDRKKEQSKKSCRGRCDY